MDIPKHFLFLLLVFFYTSVIFIRFYLRFFVKSNVQIIIFINNGVWRFVPCWCLRFSTSIRGFRLWSPRPRPSRRSDRLCRRPAVSESCDLWTTLGFWSRRGTILYKEQVTDVKRMIPLKNFYNIKNIYSIVGKIKIKRFFRKIFTIYTEPLVTRCEFGASDFMFTRHFGKTYCKTVWVTWYKIKKHEYLS